MGPSLIEIQRTPTTRIVSSTQRTTRRLPRGGVISAGVGGPGAAGPFGEEDGGGVGLFEDILGGFPHICRSASTF